MPKQTHQQNQPNELNITSKKYICTKITASYYGNQKKPPILFHSKILHTNNMCTYTLQAFPNTEHRMLVTQPPAIFYVSGVTKMYLWKQDIALSITKQV